MKNLIAIAVLVLALAGCSADPPAAPEVSAVPTNSQGTFKWPGDLITPPSVIQQPKTRQDVLLPPVKTGEYK